MGGQGRLQLCRKCCFKMLRRAQTYIVQEGQTLNGHPLNIGVRGTGGYVLILFFVVTAHRANFL